VRDGSAFAAMLGMKAGDRVTQANGIALTGIDDVLVAFVKPLVASQPVRVAGVRDGKPAAWLFLNAGACPG
jgi:S1-C subfamily serine protease